MSPVLAMVCGLLVAGGIHAVESHRPARDHRHHGRDGQLRRERGEDVVSGVTATVSVLMPVLAAVIYRWHPDLIHLVVRTPALASG